MNRGVFGLNNYDTKANPPAVDVYLSANQNVANTTNVGILFDTIVTDTHKQMNISTGVSNFTCKIPGHYLFSIACQMSGTTTLIQAQLQAWKNGVVYRYLSLLANGAGVNLLETSGSILVPLAIGDVFYPVGWLNGTGTLTFQGSTPASTWMTGIWQRPL